VAQEPGAGVQVDKKGGNGGNPSVFYYFDVIWGHCEQA